MKTLCQYTCIIASNFVIYIKPAISILMPKEFKKALRVRNNPYKRFDNEPDSTNQCIDHLENNASDERSSGTINPSDSPNLPFYFPLVDNRRTYNFCLRCVASITFRDILLLVTTLPMLWSFFELICCLMLIYECGIHKTGQVLFILSKFVLIFLYYLIYCLPMKCEGGAKRFARLVLILFVVTMLLSIKIGIEEKMGFAELYGKSLPEFLNDL